MKRTRRPLRFNLLMLLTTPISLLVWAWHDLPWWWLPIYWLMAVAVVVTLTLWMAFCDLLRSETRALIREMQELRKHP